MHRACCRTIASPRRRAFVAGACALVATAGTPARAADPPSRPIVQPATADPGAFMARAFAMKALAVARGDQPYGAVVVRGNAIVGEAPSAVVTANDPTAHAEMEAIRDASRRLRTRDLSGCELYGTSRACPMCEAAAYWAGIARMFHGPDAADAGPPRLRG